MDSTTFQVHLTDSALNDLHAIDDYWFIHGEPERGEQHVRNLIETAETGLSSPVSAQNGCPVRLSILPDTREILVFKGSSKISTGSTWPRTSSTSCASGTAAATSWIWAKAESDSIKR